MAGLYPYVDPQYLGKSALLRYEYHKSSNLKRGNEDIYLHEEQKEIADTLQRGDSVILSAPTSFGKSLIIEEVIASKKYKNVVIIQPTLALLDETRKKLKKYDKSYRIIVSTSQDPNSEGSNIFLFTGERVVEYAKFPAIDFFVIDEFYKLSLSRDDDRAVTLNQAFYKLLKLTPKFYLLGPVIKSIPIDFQKKLNVGFRHTNFSTVAIDEVQIALKSNATKEDKTVKLFELLNSFPDPTLIYCSSPERSTDIAAKFAKTLSEKTEYRERNRDIIDWVGENISADWGLVKCLEAGVGFHNGSLPRHLGSSIVDAFNAGSIKYLFCTSTLIEGVNTTAKNIVLFDNTKGNKTPIDFFDYKNIAGRSGRMKVHYTGKIYKFYDTPKQLELEVDIPFVTQTNAPIELLIQLDQEELNLESKAKLSKYNNQDPELMEIIKTNSNVSIDGQIALVKEIESNLSFYSHSITWTGFPTYKELQPVLDLAWRFLLKGKESKANVVSANQLATYTIQYSIYKNVKSIIEEQMNNPYWINKIPNPEERLNKVAFIVMNIMRHWFDYKLPKWLTTVSRLQEYVFKKNSIKTKGDYTMFAAALENGFIFSALTTLLEYDIPLSAINKLQGLFSASDTFEGIYGKLKSLNLDNQGLNNYERKKIKQIL